MINDAISEVESSISKIEFAISQLENQRIKCIQDIENLKQDKENLIISSIQL